SPVAIRVSSLTACINSIAKFHSTTLVQPFERRSLTNDSLSISRGTESFSRRDQRHLHSAHRSLVPPRPPTVPGSLHSGPARPGRPGQNAICVALPLCRIRHNGSYSASRFMPHGLRFGPV